MMNFQKHIDSYKAKASAFEADSLSFIYELLHSPLAISLALVALVLLALRFRGGAVVGASFLRAFVGRGIWMGVAVRARAMDVRPG